MIEQKRQRRLQCFAKLSQEPLKQGTSHWLASRWLARAPAVFPDLRLDVDLARNYETPRRTVARAVHCLVSGFLPPWLGSLVRWEVDVNYHGSPCRTPILVWICQDYSSPSDTVSHGFAFIPMCHTNTSWPGVSDSLLCVPIIHVMSCQTSKPP